MRRSSVFRGERHTLAAPMAAHEPQGQTDQLIEPGWGVGEASPLDKHVPDKIADMVVTPELRAMYAGFPQLLVV